MDKNSIIDKESFEVCTHAEDHPKVFVCDKLIAPAVALLNKKGYKTFASCSGHYKIEFYEYLNEYIKKLEEYQKYDDVIIKKVRDNSFDYWLEVSKTENYILFAKEYKFDTLPEGFKVEYDPRTHIWSEISFYDENDEHRKRSDIQNEIEDKCNRLKEWAECLNNNSLNRIIIEEFIDKIYIGKFDNISKNRNIEIKWDFYCKSF